MIKTLDLIQIFDPIKSEMAHLETAVSKALQAEDSFQQALNDHLLTFSGKQLRPALTLLASKFGNASQEDSIKLAVACELLHTATLIHDDIVDNSDMRRNQASLNAKWGPHISLICGDIIYAKAFQLLAELKSVELNQLFANCVAKVCTGEMKQLEARGTFDWSEATYLEMIQNKTASLFATACEAGAIISNANPNILKALSEFGSNLGMAYQIIDDCLDLIGTVDILGKEVGSDLGTNDPTLPMIYFAQTFNGSAAQELRTMLNNVEGAKEIAQIQEKITSTGALQKTIDKANTYINAAKENLKSLPITDESKALNLLVDFILQRLNAKNVQTT
jgi:octaprenyl-diphosphate synthase